MNLFVFGHPIVNFKLRKNTTSFTLKREHEKSLIVAFLSTRDSELANVTHSFPLCNEELIMIINDYMPIAMSTNLRNEMFAISHKILHYLSLTVSKSGSEWK